MSFFEFLSKLLEVPTIIFMIPIVAILGSFITKIVQSITGVIGPPHQAQSRQQLKRLEEKLTALERKLEMERRRISLEEREKIQKQALPEGTVTIMFSDIEGFSDYVDRLGDEGAYELLQMHNRIIRAAIGRQGGAEVKNYGDGFMVAFPSARKAILCALDIQKHIDEYNQNRLDEQPIRVRMGLNAGEPIKEQEDLVGRTVNLAARIAAEARGGQIFVSEVVKNLAGQMRGLQYVDRGHFKLEGFSERQRIFEIQRVEALGTPLASDVERKLERLEQRVRND